MVLGGTERPPDGDHHLSCGVPSRSMGGCHPGGAGRIGGADERPRERGVQNRCRDHSHSLDTADPGSGEGVDCRSRGGTGDRAACDPGGGRRWLPAYSSRCRGCDRGRFFMVLRRRDPANLPGAGSVVPDGRVLFVESGQLNRGKLRDNYLSKLPGTYRAHNQEEIAEVVCIDPGREVIGSGSYTNGATCTRYQLYVKAYLVNFSKSRIGVNGELGLT
jgi:hypothetical protein